MRFRKPHKGLSHPIWVRNGPMGLAAVCSLLLLTFSISGCIGGGREPGPAVSLEVQGSLPPERLSQYNDSFDGFRDDLWSQGAMVYSSAQEENFKSGDIRIKDGRIIYKLRANAYSRCSLASKFKLGGNFDIQTDVDFKFAQGVQRMNQVYYLIIWETVDGGVNSGQISLSKSDSQPDGFINCLSFQDGKQAGKSRNRLGGGFKGTLRLIRLGNRLNARYRSVENQIWSQLESVPITTNRVGVAMILANYYKHTGAHSTYFGPSITATSDNFQINAAQEIIESDI